MLVCLDRRDFIALCFLSNVLTCVSLVTSARSKQKELINTYYRVKTKISWVWLFSAHFPIFHIQNMDTGILLSSSCFASRYTLISFSSAHLGFTLGFFFLCWVKYWLSCLLQFSTNSKSSLWVRVSRSHSTECGQAALKLCVMLI